MKRYEVHITNYNSQNTLVTIYGDRRKPNNSKVFSYLRHQCDEIMELHDRLTYQAWLKDGHQRGFTSVPYDYKEYDPETAPNTFWEE